MSTQSSKGTPKGAEKSSSNPFEDLDKLKAQFKSEDNLRAFFKSLSMEKYWYIDFIEFREIFGDPIDINSLGKVKKYWVEINTEYFNLCYDNLWYYKWTPVFLKFLYKGVQGRVMSLFWLALYLEGFDYLMEPIGLHYYKNLRMIRVNEGFDYHLTKEQFIEQRHRWFSNYLEILKDDITDGVNFKPAAKELRDRINRKQKQELFEDFESSANTKPKTIFFKKEIDLIKKKGFAKFVDEKIKNFDVKQNVNNFLEEFKRVYFEYKLEYNEFPKRADFQTYFHPKFLPGSRLLSYDEEFKEKIKKLSQTVDYALGINSEDYLIRAGFIPPNEEEKKIKKKLRLKTNYADFFIYSAIFILPFRVVSLARNWRTLKFKFK